jgi:hypothetical protein
MLQEAAGSLQVIFNVGFAGQDRLRQNNAEGVIRGF